MKTIDWARVLLLVIAIVLLMRGIDRLRYPKYELVLTGASEVSGADESAAPPRVKQSVPAVVFAIVQISIGALLAGGVGWTVWAWDRWRLQGTPGGGGA